MAGASAGVFHRAVTKVNLMCHLRNPLLHASQVRAEFPLASFPPHDDMNCVSSHALCGSVSLHGSEKISHWRCVTYISYSVSAQECLDSFQCESLSFPFLCVSVSLQHCCLTSLFWFIHFCNALISQVVWTLTFFFKLSFLSHAVGLWKRLVYHQFLFRFSSSFLL